MENKRLKNSMSYKKTKKNKENNYDDDFDITPLNDDSLIKQISSLYGEDYDFSVLSENELKEFLDYALNTYKNNEFSLENIPIDLKIKLNSLPVLEFNKENKTKPSKSNKKQDILSWNNKFDIPSNINDDKNVIIEADIKMCANKTKQIIEELFVSYVDFAEEKKLNVEIVEMSDKKISFLINGENAFKHFKFEKGLHYIKEKETNSNIFISVIPQFPIQEELLEIKSEDLKIDVYHSGGAGGQHVNKTSSAVRITHLPTGLVVACQEQSSQLKNKKQAMKLLCAKLMEIEKNKNTVDSFKKKIEGHDTSRIRTYDFNKKIITDHRLNLKINIDKKIKISKIINDLENYCNNDINKEEVR